jgi:hypothetical protein
VHGRRIISVDKVNVITVSFEELLDILISVPAQHGGPGNLVAIQVEDRQHDAVVDRVQKLDALPRAFERSRLRLAITDYCDGDEVRIIEYGAKGVRENVAEFAALVNRPGSLDAGVAWDASRSRELAEEAPQARGIP